MEALKATALCRRYGSQEVLRDFALTVEEGRFEALMGPSGSGKSTFLHIAAGLLAADSGTVEVGGRNVTGMSDGSATKFRRRHVGFVFQSFNLLNERTVAENIWLPLKLDGMRPDAKLRARFDSLVSRLGIAHTLSRRPEQLSGGEQQRVAIARAIIAEPEIVLADEPTGNLDAKSAKAICSLLRELNAIEKSAILVVTHDPVVAACASRVHFIGDGRIVASHETNGDAELVARFALEYCQ